MVGRPFALTLTAGNAADITVAPALLARAERIMKYLIADKGYDGGGLRSALRQAGAVPVIPGRANRKHKVRLDVRHYKDRHLLDRFADGERGLR
ncbi:transposase [Glycocaulis profundi]|nr:transposase [Glycocaulis profundi]